MKKYEIQLKNLDCAGFANEIQQKLSKNPKLHNVNVNFGKLKLTYETDEVSVEEVEKIVKSQEPDVEMIRTDVKVNSEEQKTKTVWQLIRLIVGAGIAIAGITLELPVVLKTILVIL